MDEISQKIAHISCPTCEKKWQVLNEDGTDWNEQATAEQYQQDLNSCTQCPNSE